MKLTIDGKELELDQPTTLFHAAQKVGVDIPVMCYKEGYDYFTSCMICVVKDRTSGRTLPACSAEAVDGMVIETQCDEIRESRKSTLELLLSEHVGDCEAPCQRVCPISMEVPKMIREIMEDQPEEAIATVRLDMPIPSILERYCNAPCENGCRRSKFDEGLSIRELTRYAADWDLGRGEAAHLPPIKAATGKKVAILGAGATGLSSAHYLAMAGHAVTVFEREAVAGGRIAREFTEPALPDWVMTGELNLLRRMGIVLHFGQGLGEQLTLDQLRKDYDAVLLCLGDTTDEQLSAWGLPMAKKGIKHDAKTWMTGIDGVFAGGSILKGGQPLIKSVTAAQLMSACASQYLLSQPITGKYEMYNHTMGRLLDGEIDTFVSGADPRPRIKSDDLIERGYNRAEARTEATRCMHCDCREMHNCKLRTYSDEYGAKQQQFKAEEREVYVHVNQNAGAVYEPGKCIKCGLCVRVTKAEGEEFGFTFVGRGFELKTAVPLNKTLTQGLERVAAMVVEACPTGALSDNEKLYSRKGLIEPLVV